MFDRILFALAVAGLAGTSMLAAQAQERPPGHESAVGPHSAEHGPGAAGEGRQAPVPMQQGGPVAPGARPGPSAAPGRIQQAPALGQRPIEQAPMRPMQQVPQQPMQQPMQQAPRAPIRPNDRPAGGPNYGQQHAPGMAPQRAPVAPIEHAPRAYGAVPAPYRGTIHRFVDQDARVWRGGHWHHDHHRGRYGWWWVVGGLWYFYPQPVYPYPDPFSPGDVDYGPSGPGQYWYYCESKGQYYPYVTDCPEGWEAVIPDEQ